MARGNSLLTRAALPSRDPLSTTICSMLMAPEIILRYRPETSADELTSLVRPLSVTHCTTGIVRLSARVRPADAAEQDIRRSDQFCAPDAFVERRWMDGAPERTSEGSKQGCRTRESINAGLAAPGARSCPRRVLLARCPLARGAPRQVSAARSPRSSRRAGGTSGTRTGRTF